MAVTKLMLTEFCIHCGLESCGGYLLLQVAITNTGNDRYSGDRFSGNDGFSGTKNPDAAILFTVS